MREAFYGCNVDPSFICDSTVRIYRFTVKRAAHRAAQVTFLSELTERVCKSQLAIQSIFSFSQFVSYCVPLVATPVVMMMVRHPVALFEGMPMAVPEVRADGVNLVHHRGVIDCGTQAGTSRRHRGSARYKRTGRQNSHGCGNGQI